MNDSDVSDFFLSDSDEDLTLDDEQPIKPPVVVPPAPPAISSVPSTEPETPDSTEPETPDSTAISQPAEKPTVQEEPATKTTPVADSPQQDTTEPAVPTREARLAVALRRLMEESQDIEAAALVSLDGFTMASALPDGMHEDRVGAMSAAILGLGERAAVELGKGKLSQVFIEGDGGYVLLIAAGDRAVLTCLADEAAKLGLVLYDMRLAAQSIGEILG